MRGLRTPRGRRRGRREEGFSLIEALIGIAVMGIAMLGLAEAFLIGIKNNRRAGEISSAVLLAQQRIDDLRALTAEELDTFPSSTRGEQADETLDPNGDGTPDFRRITQVQAVSLTYTVKVLVFPAIRIGESLDALVADPWAKSVRAVMNTVITR